jgi:hypothetical protein
MRYKQKNKPQTASGFTPDKTIQGASYFGGNLRNPAPQNSKFTQEEE